jgi:Zn-dependent protease
MGEFQTIVGIALLAFVASFAFRFIAMFVGMLRMPFWEVKYTPVVPEPQLAPDEQAAVDELAGLGFKRVAADRMDMGPLSSGSLCFEHEDGKSFASIVFLAGATHDFIVEFFSFAADGRMLLTLNRSGWLLGNCHLDAEIADALTGSLEEHWKFHRERIRDQALISVEAKEANRRQIAVSEGSLARMIEAGAVVQGRDGAWHYTLRSAWRTVLGWWKLRAKLAKPYRSAVSEGPHRSQLFARIYNQIEAVNAAKPPRPNVTAGLLILTAAVSLAFWGNFFDWTFAVILVAVILLHESGHALAMRAFGYRDISMFFIPFIGAAVTGTPKEMPVWKQAIMLLAGPVPGLVAALAFFVYRGFYPFETPYFDFGQAAVVALTVNLLNLLPITPLDGGQLLEISVFSRWPRARLAFSALSVLALTALAAWLEDPYLWFIVAFLSYTLFYKWRMTALHRAWQEGLTAREQLEHLFSVARQVFGPQAFARHYRLVKAVFSQRKILKPRLWESALALSVMVLVWAPIGVAAVELWPHTQIKLVPAATPDLRTAAQREFDTAFSDYVDKEGSDQELAALVTLAAKFEASDPRLIDLAVQKALALPLDEQASRLQSLLQQLRAGSFYSLEDIVTHLAGIAAEENEGEPIGERIASLRASLDRISATWPGSLPATVTYRIRLAEMIAESGDAAGAASTLQSLREGLIRAKAEPKLITSVVRVQAWFYISREELGQARQLLKEAMATAPVLPRRLARDYAWTLLLSGDAKEGVRQMRVVAYSSPANPTFIDNALGVKAKPKLQLPFDLAYAMMKAKRTDEAAALVAREAPEVCRAAPQPWYGAWYGPYNRAIQAAYAVVCPAPAKAADASK